MSSSVSLWRYQEVGQQKERAVKVKAAKAYLSCKNLLLLPRGEENCQNFDFSLFQLDATATEARSQRHSLIGKAAIQGIREVTLTDSEMPETEPAANNIDWWEAGELLHLCWRAD